LKRLDQLKDQFLANTSHELRTPLNGIIGIAESLRDGIAGQLPKKANSNLNVIISSGKRLANLVNDVLDFSKLKNKDLVLQLRPVDMHSAVDVVLTLSEPIVQRKKLALINNVPRDVPLVEADENRVQQILHNLVGNAIKFTEKGGISIACRANDGVLKISVSDTGIGIPEDKFETIFQSFEQAEGGIAREYGGTGLGLSVTKQLVKLHGGNISLESEIGKGSTFSFTLPLSQDKREDMPELEFTKGAESRISVVETSPQEELAAPSIMAITAEDAARILIVDDEPVNLQVLENHLGLAGYEITAAGSGTEALQIITDSQSFDLILLDIMMPKMSGYEVCHKLRETNLPGELPIVMLTAKNRVTDLVEGFSVGANDYLTKPFSKAELLSRVKTHLHLHRIHRATGKFVPYEFLRSLGRDSITDVQLGDHAEKEVTVFFSDIRDFTTMAEKLTPTENFDFVSQYVGQMNPIIHNNQGFVNQYFGDGIMAIFPKEGEHALSAAVAMQKRIIEFNKKELRNSPIRVGMGLHSGKLVMGIIGDANRNDPATIADTVNAASRMEGLTKHFGANIIVSENCMNSLKNRDQFHFRYMGKVRVKGKNNAIGVYECFDGDTQAIRDNKLKDLALFEEGMQNYTSREFADATAIFNKILKSSQEDRVADYFRNRAARFTIEGVPDDWDGVERLETK